MPYLERLEIEIGILTMPLRGMTPFIFGGNVAAAPPPFMPSKLAPPPRS